MVYISEVICGCDELIESHEYCIDSLWEFASATVNAAWCREWWKGDHAPAWWREQDVIVYMYIVDLYIL